jgi:hypothetical protein
MLFVYLFFPSFSEVRVLCDIDLSTLSSELLADECDRIIDHHTNKTIFLGYLEPGWMLDPKHEARIRRMIRKFDVHMVCMFPESLSFSWKNEINTLYTERPNGFTDTHHDGRIVHNGSQVEHRHFGS